ncbi:MAG: HDIG domain-containing protein [Clostridia bacterium]|nr:HDIG domain-containing protein [Clostridia bacterium]
MMRRKWSERDRSRSWLRRVGLWFHSVEARCTLIVAIGTLAIFGLFSLASAPQRYNLSVGSISHQTITATKDVVDEIATADRRSAAAAAVEPTYHLQEGASEEVMSSLEGLLAELRTVQQYGLTLRGEGVTDEEWRYHSFTDSELDYAQSLVKTISLTRYQATTLMRTSTDDYDEMVTSLMQAVQNTLNTTIREGQVTQSINTILQIVGYKVDISLFQNIVPAVLRSCIKPNMVIEEEATAAARQKAMDAVEPVVYLQGQNIVREGEQVNANQIAMLTALGLLENDDYDYSIYIGAALMVLAAVVLMALMLKLQHPELLRDARRMSVIMLVLVINMGLSVLMTKLIHIYRSPVNMASMLLTSLLGVPAGLAASLSMSVLCSSLAAASNTAFSAEMVHILMAGVLGGAVTVHFLKGKPQRFRVVLCGLLVGVLNMLLILATGLMTSNDLHAVLVSACWALGGGALSALLAAGLQPVCEAVFNLATPSKLLELANPNHPLLRRLLIEAPGTYHHAIIVANLAEAAAEKIGANHILARTGAYFHDVGKLKRPLYFKENQMGENPHDRTDPYVSAAIVTAHTRDGVQLAQKYHLPPEIQRIIAEHHGDTPVMFFYHKALQQADGKAVDVADFRYDGCRPSTRESAVIMLADTIEAAVRSMPDPTPQAIERFIERLVRGKLEDGQLSNSPLTLQDIDGICEAFATVLNGVFHERIEYPTVAVPARNGEALVAAPAPVKAVEAPKEPAPAETAADPAPAEEAVEKPADEEKEGQA